MGTPTRFPNGITNNKSGPLRDFTTLDPSKVFVHFDDFLEFDPTPWTVTTTEAGAGSASEVAGDAAFGQLTITNDDADNDNDFIFWDGENILITAGKQTWFKTRFKVSDATQSDVVIGLMINDTSPLDTTDGIFFQKDDGDTNVDFHVEKNNTATTQAAVTTLADDTFIELAWYYNGKDEIEVWADGVKVYTQTTLDNLPDDTEITFNFGIQNGEAAAKVMTVDYLFAATER